MTKRRETQKTDTRAALLTFLAFCVNVGRPPKEPTGAITALTLKIPSDVKRKLIDDADSVGMTLTEYLITLIQKQ